MPKVKIKFNEKLNREIKQLNKKDHHYDGQSKDKVFIIVIVKHSLLLEQVE